jgi:hypothetical protein
MRHALLAALLAAGVLAGSGCASDPAPPPEPYRLNPVGTAGQALPPEEPLVVVREGVRLRVQSLGARDREVWLRRKVGTDEDPLAALEGGARFLTLRVGLEATGEEPVHLETQSIRLILSGQGAGVAALDAPRAYEILRPSIEGRAPERGELRRFMKGLLDGAVTVPAGSSREGLLVFPEPPATREEPPAFVLELPFLQVGSTTHRLRLPFVPLFLHAPAEETASGAARETR